MRAPCLLIRARAPHRASALVSRAQTHRCANALLDPSASTHRASALMGLAQAHIVQAHSWAPRKHTSCKRTHRPSASTSLCKRTCQPSASTSWCKRACQPSASTSWCKHPLRPSASTSLCKRTLASHWYAAVVTAYLISVTVLSVPTKSTQQPATVPRPAFCRTLTITFSPFIKD